MFLNQDIVQQLRDGRWETDCVQMTLTQDEAAAPASFVGQGFLRQGAHGTIHYRLYPSAVVGVEPHAGLQPPGVPGMLIEPHRFYRLEAYADNGLCWQVARTIPDIDVSHLDDGFHFLAGGKASEVSFTRPFPIPVTKFYLTMVFFVDVAIPFNARTVTTLNIAGQQHQSSSSLNVARVSTSFGEFRVSKKAGMVIVEVEADNAFPDDFENRIVEALGLVLATPLYWNAIFRVENGNETLRLRGRPHAVNAQLPRPVTGPHEDADTSGDVWRLFDRYLTLVCTHDGPGFHPCSRHLFAVLEASAGAITGTGLALGVAAEGIVKTLFPAAGTPMVGMAEIVTPLQEYCLAWPDIPGDERGESLTRRLPGMIGQLTNVSTKDKLYAVAKSKVVYEEHIKAWDKLRNTLAHGVTPGSKGIQKLVDLCNKVTVMMYHIIFRGCGYEGSYEDYSTYGFPTRYYRGRPVTEEEKAIAAYYLSLKNMHQDDVARWYAGMNDLEKGIY
jgi:hypothetical protein